MNGFIGAHAQDLGVWKGIRALVNSLSQLQAIIEPSGRQSEQPIENQYYLCLPVWQHNFRMQSPGNDLSGLVGVHCQVDQMRDSTSHSRTVYSPFGEYAAHYSFLVTIGDVTTRDSNVVQKQPRIRTVLPWVRHPLPRDRNVYPLGSDDWD